MRVLLSTIDPPPPGFTWVAEVQKRELLAGPVAVYCQSIDLLLPRVELFLRRVAGVLVVPGDDFGQLQLGALLWQMTVPDALLPMLRVLVAPLLAAVEAAMSQREQAVELGCVLARTRHDLDTVRSDYQRVTGRLQQQVHQLVEAQAELLQSETELRTIVDLLPQHIYATGSDGRLLLANLAFARAQDVEAPAMLLGRYEAELALPARWLSLSAEVDRQVREGGHSVELPEMALVCPDGEVRHFEAAKLPWKTGGESAVLTVLHDISVRYALERQLHGLNEELERRVAQRTAALEEANRELEAFSYSVSHDLRAPLRAVMGFSQILAEEAQDRLEQGQQDLLGRVQAAAARMNQLIDDLLNLAQTSRQNLQRGALDVSALAATVWRDFAHLRVARTFEFHCEPAMSVRADGRLLRLVLEQLLVNAIKFTRGREPARVAVGRIEQGGEVAFFVSDNGAGFDMERADKLFAPFQRLHAASEFEGSGIGLATARRAISRHGGRIWAEAAVGQGATFWFTLPE
ncbi:sensor histidine kinase [Chitinimonas koreensis]|uniref:sensor histidine kinase n=1 Tax=Chitinimonas koreensis TaxID=356302 RepID=UPI000405F0EC|nr:ATP-binding protein [Chitinimonas koreensis]QNM97588.1 PAS domain-containing protein [Chitinimonas koreensis]